MPDKGGHAGNNRGRGVAIGGRLAIVAELDLVVAAIIAFFIRFVSGIAEETGRDVDTHGQVDMFAEVGAEARSDEHRVDQGITRVLGLFYAHFAGEFDKEIDRIARKQVQGRSIGNYVGLVMPEGLEEAAAQVPADRETELGEIKGKSKGCGKGHALSGIGGGRTRVVEIPGMAGTHTGTVGSRRDIHFEEGGNAKEEAVVKRDAELCPDIHIAHARGPHFIAHGRPVVRVGVIIVNRQAGTDIPEVQKADTQVHVSRQRGIVRIE